MTDDLLPDDSMQEVHSLVLVCLGATDPERELEERTAQRPHLRSLVRQILAQARQQNAGSEGADGEQIGPFHIVRQLGAGGMGTVFLAEQTTPITRTVALKLIKPGMDTDDVLRRFEFERQTLALMNHDNIARVFDAGKTPRGRPYFAMEYVIGMPLTTFADVHRLSIAARLELMLQVCAGVQHAHQRGIVHRDLKPNNILVVEQDGRGVPKIIDFGLARATQQQRHDVTKLTRDGRVLGTPAYMSPEQTEATDEAIDTRSDVYALGVILYELLGGELPFGHDELLARNPTEMLRVIREVEPPRPSRRLTPRGEGSEAVARLRSTTVAALSAALRRDLDWIVMLALRKEREQRYASVGDLAADLRRFLADEPVSATAPSTVYRLRKLLRRYRVQAIAAGLVLACLIGGLIVSLVFFFAAERAHTATKEATYRLDPLLLIALQQEAANDLWPIHPSRADRMQRWLERTEDLRSRAATQRAYLAELMAKEEQARAVGTTSAPSLLEQIREQRAFVGGLAQLEAPGDRLANNIAGVSARLVAARTLRERTIEAHRESWSAAGDGMRASTPYRGLDLVPQLGLVPLGMDPTSKLQEFYHVDSGEADVPLPTRDANGHIAMRPELGFVFALVPGGTFIMGADQEHDPNAEPDEGPRHEVTLAPFFMSKFECTQAQWRRLTGRAPSRFGPGYAPPVGAGPTWLNPVEQVLWDEVMTACFRVGLTLPTEAQWEYACRAGTTAVYAFGDDATELQYYENMADSYAAEWRAAWGGLEPWQDAFILHAPVGSFAANPFGLHDMHGNITEMCRDWELDYKQPVQPGDGLRQPPLATAEAMPAIRICRGGSWMDTRRQARCADRAETTERLASNLIGFRPVRSMHHVP